MQKKIAVTAVDRENLFSELVAVFEESKMDIHEFQIENAVSYGGKSFSTYNFTVSGSEISNEINLVKKLQEIDGVTKIMM